MDNSMNNPNVNPSQARQDEHIQEAHVEEIEDLDLLTALISELEDDDEISVTINHANAVSPVEGEEDYSQVDIDVMDEEDDAYDNSQSDAGDNFQIDFL